MQPKKGFALISITVFTIIIVLYIFSLQDKAVKHANGKFTMDEFMGVNGFIDDPVDKLAAVGFVREYHNWEWNDDGKNYQGYPHNQIKWTHGDWNFDTFYSSVTQAGLNISPCIQGNVKWLYKGLTGNSDKPLDEANSSASNPVSYQKKAHFMYQYAAHYGTTEVPDEKLTVAKREPTNSGLGLIHYIEDWNEQNKNWEGEKARFSPEEYAAMASADYDGHCKTMTMGSGTFGVKNADPNMKFVMGGLAGLKLDYVKRMKTWFERNRADKKFAADVLNFHVYGWKHEEGWTGGGPPKSPEESKFKERLEEITAYRDKHLPGLEVWVSEFGWDTNPGSPLCPPAIGSYDIQEVQAQWIVRSYLAFAAAGVDRAQIYMLRDVDPKSTVWYASCGMIGPKGDFTPKKSWYYVYTTKNTLKSMVFCGEQPSGNKKILIYKFREPGKKKMVYAVWANSSSGKIIKDFRLKLPDNFSSALGISLIPGKTNGKVVKLIAAKTREITINISERPFFIQFN